jgi:4-amino-4-deoxy-L-arabinose transferase-like glycosyltransferase
MRRLKKTTLMTPGNERSWSLTLMRMGKQPQVASPRTKDPAIHWVFAFFVFSGWLLLWNLPIAALFEPDEGRNAEIAREVLLLKDWVTPHYDFIPRLDKPILFFDLVALSYKIFGISEWSSRLCSALAALGCLFLTYFFSCRWFGRSVGLWSALILLTSPEFFALSQTAIVDMLLIFFLSVAMVCFFMGQSQFGRGNGRAQFLLMYAAIGAATATKGPIGILIPAAVIFFYIFLTKRWVLLKSMDPLLGAALVVAVAVPWYVLVESRHPGYLYHFIWQENVARFTTTEFKRSGPWYYFLVVLSAGFFPWTILLPFMMRDLWKRDLRGERLFLTLWIVLPLIFFSLSSSKLSHYILPIFPPLAIMAAAAIERSLTDCSSRMRWFVSFVPLYFVLLSIGMVVIALWPGLLPERMQNYIHPALFEARLPLILSLAAVMVIYLWFAGKSLLSRQHFWPPAICAGFVFFTLCAEPILSMVSAHRSSKQLAEAAASVIQLEDQVVLFDTYPSSLPFYLQIQRPIWVIWSGDKRTVLGSDYIAKERPRPASGNGQVLFTYDEFFDLWRTSQRRLVVFLDRIDADRLTLLLGKKPETILQVGERLVVVNS